MVVAAVLAALRLLSFLAGSTVRVGALALVAIPEVEVAAARAIGLQPILQGNDKTGVKNYWVHEDPITKSKRITNNLGAIVSTIEMDPWGADTNRSSNGAFQPRKFTSYERDANGSDEAMFRRSNRWHSRFDQPDPYAGSCDFSDSQSFNRNMMLFGCSWENIRSTHRRDDSGAHAE